MDRTFAEPLCIPRLARVAEVSEAHFIRTFRLTFGETPHRHLQRRRVEPILLKSAPGRVVFRDGWYEVRGAAWGAPIATVQVQIDGGPWLTAKLDTRSETPSAGDDNDGLPDSASNRFLSGRRHSRGYAWTLWKFQWGRPASGEHTVRSRAIDTHGNIQPAPDDPFLASKVTYWESNGQITRRIVIP